MASFSSNFILAVRIHLFKNKAVIHQLDAYWITEELSTHRRYSPFMLEVQKSKDLKTYFWRLSSFSAFVLVIGLILCTCSHWAIQCSGIAVCLLATFMIATIVSAIRRSHKTGVLSNKESA